MRKRILSLLLATCMTVGLLAGCGGNSGSSDSAEGSSGGGSGDDIVIGAVYPMTGDLADSGKTMQQGIDMAVEEINEEGGIDGKQIKVIYGDSQGDSAKGMTEAERLITQENVDMLIGCYQSGVTVTVAQVAEQYQVPMITANATSDELTSNGYEYFFRLAPTNMMFVRDMVQYLSDEKEKNPDFKADSVAVFADNSEVGQQTVEWTEYWAGENGIDYLGAVTYTSGAADLSSEVLELKSMNPDVVVADCYVSDAILFTNTLLEQGYKPPVIICKGNGFTESAYLESVGEHANGIIVATEFVVGTKGDDINAKYKEKYGEDFNGHSAEAYTTTWVIIDALKSIVDNGEDISRETIQQAMKNIKIENEFSNGNEIILPYDTITFGEDEFNGMPYLNQNLDATLTVTQITDGSTYVPIWPHDIAQADVVYPATYE